MLPPDARARRRVRAARARSGRVVGVEQRGVARQVQVPQARDPEAQRRGAHQRRQQAELGAGQRPHRVVGGDEGAARGPRRGGRCRGRCTSRSGTRRCRTARCRRRRSRSRRSRVSRSWPRCRARTSRCRGTGRRGSAPRGSARVGRPTRPAAAGRRVRSSISARCAGVEEGAAPPARSRSTRPGRAGWAAAAAKSCAGQVHARQHLADLRAVRARRAPAGGRRAGGRPRPPACPCSVCRSAPLGVGLRRGHRDAALRQVLHQVQVEGQLLEASAARTASARSCAAASVSAK